MSFLRYEIEKNAGAEGLGGAEKSGMEDVYENS